MMDPSNGIDQDRRATQSRKTSEPSRRRERFVGLVIACAALLSSMLGGYLGIAMSNRGGVSTENLVLPPVLAALPWFALALAGWGARTRGSRVAARVMLGFAIAGIVGLGVLVAMTVVALGGLAHGLR